MSYVPNGSKLLLQTEDDFRNLDDAFSKKGLRNRARRGKKTAASNSSYPIVVHSHLCWDWVWQRPQQFISRLSRRHKILFVETLGPDPQLSSPVARFWQPEKFPNVTILRIQFPSWRWGEGAYIDQERRRLVHEFLGGPGAGEFENPVQWFYDPMAVTAFAGSMDERLTVYDCMDEMSKFSEAPPEIKTRERRLLEIADVVFAGGRKLHEAKTRFNGNCHFYGCGVDTEHFGKARHASTTVPADLAALSKPALGYFGVVDERMDYELVTRLADANPDWSIVMIGPVLKVKTVSLPKRRNLHWLGQRAYADLPSYCKGFELCLMPFALNDATEFINPTKALEYMAAGRVIVSSAVPDVVRNFGSIVKIARSHDEFITHCQRSIAQPSPETVALGLRMAEESTWESIVARLEYHIGQALRKKADRRAVA
jgi:glycosyltransferase involved in cell wall biosynthesis